MRIRPLAVLGWTVVLSVLGWHALPVVVAWLQPQPLPFEPDTVMTAIAHRETGEKLAGFVPGPGGSEPPLFERCAPGTPDEARLHYFDTWFLEAFTLAIRTMPEGAQATWRTVRNGPAKAGFEFGEPRLTTVPHKEWEALRVSLRAPDFTGLAPEEGVEVIDGMQVSIESCLEGNYRVVVRSSPAGSDYAEFIGHARHISAAAGDVYALPESSK
jgi:hypothetical protein